MGTSTTLGVVMVVIVAGQRWRGRGCDMACGFVLWVRVDGFVCGGPVWRWSAMGRGVVECSCSVALPPSATILATPKEEAVDDKLGFSPVIKISTWAPPSHGSSPPLPPHHGMQDPLQHLSCHLFSAASVSGGFGSLLTNKRFMTYYCFSRAYLNPTSVSLHANLWSPHTPFAIGVCNFCHPVTARKTHHDIALQHHHNTACKPPQCHNAVCTPQEIPPQRRLNTVCKSRLNASRERQQADGQAITATSSDEDDSNNDHDHNGAVRTATTATQSDEDPSWATRRCASSIPGPFDRACLCVMHNVIQIFASWAVMWVAMSKRKKKKKKNALNEVCRGGRRWYWSDVTMVLVGNRVGGVGGNASGQRKRKRLVGSERVGVLVGPVNRVEGVVVVVEVDGDRGREFMCGEAARQL
ncbi:hypothetical protein EDB83DRAFT_2322147 [Lactarius deliciosus]|nr:hypothetical protein EDB83DRAFT_2322147 [Lactarius deliciosus]